MVAPYRKCNISAFILLVVAAFIKGNKVNKSGQIPKD